MLEPENDKLKDEVRPEGGGLNEEVRQNLDEAEEPIAQEPITEEHKEAHLHKTISSIFGHAPALKMKSEEPKEAPKNERYSPAGAKGKAEMLFKALFVICLASAIFFYARSQQVANLKLEMEGKLTQVTAEANALHASIEAMKQSVGTTDQLKAELDKLKSGSAKLLKRLELVSKEKTNLATTLQEKDKKIQDLVNQLAELKSAKAGLGRSAGAGLSARAVSVDAAKRTGKILVVKPASNFAVINLGSKDEVEAGSTFEIYGPNNSYVAKLIIDEVESTISIGKINPETESDKVKENYTVQEK